jgi:hypothetical protein
MCRINRVFVLLALCCTAMVPNMVQAQSVSAVENYSDIWWNANESGWGVTIADHDTNIFAVLYTYRADGRPVWFTIPGGAFSQGRRIFQGDIYETRGPAYTSAVFDSSLVTGAKVGTATFDFSPPGLAAGTALFTYTISGVNKTKQIQRQAFGNAPANWGTDKTDLWFNPAESGWGLALAQHGNNIFGVWYTYDTDGAPLWFVLPGGSFAGPNSFSGTLYRTTGPYFGNASFDPSMVIGAQAGTATIDFSGTHSLNMASFAKAKTACPGLSADFVATYDGTGYPRLTCPQPFGDLAPPNPGPNAGLILGTYSGNTTLTDTIVTPSSSAINTLPFPMGFTIGLVNGKPAVLANSFNLAATPFDNSDAALTAANTFSTSFIVSGGGLTGTCTLSGTIVVGSSSSTGSGNISCVGGSGGASETDTGPWTASNP